MSLELDVTKALHDAYKKYVADSKDNGEVFKTYEAWFNEAALESTEEMNKIYGVDAKLREERR
jgi:hypothetical protein